MTKINYHNKEVAVLKRHGLTVRWASLYISYSSISPHAKVIINNTDSPFSVLKIAINNRLRGRTDAI